MMVKWTVRQKIIYFIGGVNMVIELKLLSCTDIENWLTYGDAYWEKHELDYFGEGIGDGLRIPLQKKLENMKNDPGNDKWYSYYCIIYQNKVVGLIGSKGKKDINKSIEIGYGIGKRYRNLGLATAALMSFSKMFFINEDIDFIIARTLKNNIPSQKVLNKCYFNKIGEEKDEFIWRLNKKHSICY